MRVGLRLQRKRPLLERALRLVRIGFGLQGGPLLERALRLVRVGLRLQGRAVLGRSVLERAVNERLGLTSH